MGNTLEQWRVLSLLPICIETKLQEHDDFYTQSHNLLAKYKVSLTNKIHLINDCFDFYIKRNNKSIGFFREEGIESAHAIN